MTTTPSTLLPAEPFPVAALVAVPPGGIASRVLAKTGGGNVTAFAFDAGQELSEHTAPFDALVLVIDGTFTLTIGGRAVAAAAGDLVRMPAGVPHAVAAGTAGHLLLVMLRATAA